MRGSCEGRTTRGRGRSTLRRLKRCVPGVDEGGLPFLVRVQVRHAQRAQVLRRDRRVDQVRHVGHRLVSTNGKFHEEIRDPQDNVGDVVGLGVLECPELVQALHVLLHDVVGRPRRQLHAAVGVAVVVVVVRVRVALLRLLLLPRVPAVLILTTTKGHTQSHHTRESPLRCCARIVGGRYRTFTVGVCRVRDAQNLMKSLLNFGVHHRSNISMSVRQFLTCHQRERERVRDRGA